jgi:hypothetical protein
MRGEDLPEDPTSRSRALWRRLPYSHGIPDIYDLRVGLLLLPYIILAFSRKCMSNIPEFHNLPSPSFHNFNHTYSLLQCLGL